MTYAPGERGEVVARFQMGTRTGDQSAIIRVSVKGRREPAILTLNVAIPEAAKIRPLMLVWTTGEPPDPKTVEVEAVPHQPLRVTRVTSNPPGFETRVETIAEAAKYRVIVTPENTERPAFSIVNIEAQFEDGRKTFQAYVQTRQAAGAGVRAPRALAARTGIPAPQPAGAEVIVEPAVLVWDIGKEPAEKSMTVRPSAAASLKSVKVTSSSATFETKVEEVRESAEYRITVTPRNVDKEELGFVSVEVELESGKVTRRGYVQIKQ